MTKLFFGIWDKTEAMGGKRQEDYIIQYITENNENVLLENLRQWNEERSTEIFEKK